MKKIDDLEKYYFWIKANNFLLLPSFIISLFIIIIFIVLTILHFMKIEIVEKYFIPYMLAFPLFLLAIWIVFTAILFEDIKVMKK